MLGLSERQYAAHAGLSRGAIQKAKEAGRLVYRAHVLNIKGRSYRLRDLEDALKG